MAAKFPEVERLRERLRAKVDELRSRIGVRGGYAPQMRVGGGQLIERARTKADEIMRRVRERKPEIIPAVKEFKPGERIRKIVGTFRTDITSLPEPTRSGRGFSIAEESAKPADKREIVVEA